MGGGTEGRPDARKTRRVVVAGCGGMANAWLDDALKREGVEIVGLMDIAPASARSMAERHGLACPVFTDLERAIRETGADLVFDVTIPAAHHATVTTALSLGCDVLGEKPMAETMEQARDMVAAAARTGRTYAVMQNRRYLRDIHRFAHLVRDGAIGVNGFLNADFFLGPHFGGFRDLMDSPLVLDMTIHTFDQARLISGADAVAVYCHEFNPAGSWYRGNASTVCIFEMSDGSVFCYRGSWCANGAPTSWESSWRAVGSRGTALWDGQGAPWADVVTDPEDDGFLRGCVRVEAPEPADGPAGPEREQHAGCLDAMFAALERGTRPETDCTDNLRSMEMVFGALRSAREKRRIEL
jgi:predicted dehydrogenase